MSVINILVIASFWELIHCKKVQVSNDQEKAQSERDSLSKNGGGKKLDSQLGTYTMKTYRKLFSK